jgi:hypothetical protein
LRLASLFTLLHTRENSLLTNKKERRKGGKRRRNVHGAAARCAFQKQAFSSNLGVEVKLAFHLENPRKEDATTNSVPISVTISTASVVFPALHRIWPPDGWGRGAWHML